MPSEAVTEDPDIADCLEVEMQWQGRLLTAKAGSGKNRCWCGGERVL